MGGPEPHMGPWGHIISEHLVLWTFGGHDNLCWNVVLLLGFWGHDDLYWNAILFCSVSVSSYCVCSFVVCVGGMMSYTKTPFVFLGWHLGPLSKS